MKRETVLLLLMAVVVTAFGQSNKYGIKSAIITFEQVADVGGMKLSNKVMVYFDDYGLRECRETYDGDRIKEAFFSDGKNLYLVIPAEKAAYDRGTAYRGTEYRFDLNEISQKDKDAHKAKKLANTTIAGKDCESFQLDTQYGTAVFAGWKNITFLTSTSSKSMKSAVKAKKFEENVNVPAEKFKIPAGYAVKK
jgi:hypothetical protein